MDISGILKKIRAFSQSIYGTTYSTKVILHMASVISKLP